MTGFSRGLGKSPPSLWTAVLTMGVLITGRGGNLDTNRGSNLLITARTFKVILLSTRSSMSLRKERGTSNSDGLGHSVLVTVGPVTCR